MSGTTQDMLTVAARDLARDGQEGALVESVVMLYEWVDAEGAPFVTFQCTDAMGEQPPIWRTIGVLEFELGVLRDCVGGRVQSN